MRIAIAHISQAHFKWFYPVEYGLEHGERKKRAKERDSGIITVEIAKMQT